MILLLLLTQLAFADDYQVEVDPQVYSHQDFAKPGVKTAAMPSRVGRPDALPNKTERDGAFAKVPGLVDSLGGMDELDRDLLYERAKTRSSAELRGFYPKIPAAKLARLQQEIRR